MPESTEITTKTQASLELYNSVVRDSHRIVAVAGSGLTVTSGAITVDPGAGEMHYALDTEGSALSDDLDTINGGSAGDTISVYLTDTSRVVKLKHNTGNIKLPGGKDFDLKSDLAVMLRYDGSFWWMIGGAGDGADGPSATSFLSLTNSYQDLVPAPASGICRVMQICFSNKDSSVTTSFYFKIVRSSTDYLIFEIVLAPDEEFTLNCPIVLSTVDSIQAKVFATCTGYASASYLVSSGGLDLLNFTGDTFADVLTVPAGKKHLIDSVMIMNSDPTSQTVSIQIIDDSSNVKLLKRRILKSGVVWFLGVQAVLQAGWKIQVKHGAALKTGSCAITYSEV